MLGAPQPRTMIVQDAAQHLNGKEEIVYKLAQRRLLPGRQGGRHVGRVADRPRRLGRRAETGQGAGFGTTAAPLRGAGWSFRR